MWEDGAQKQLREQEGEALSGFEEEGAGNLYGFLKGTIPGDPILLCAHLDTVEPGHGKRAVFEDDGTIRSGGDTVLGADDLAGLAEILEGIRCVLESGLEHRDIEVICPVAEEAYAKGSALLDYGRIRAKEAYVFDLSGPVGAAALRAPSLLSFRAAVTGKASHAGFAPEDGIHAIACMANAVSNLPQGRIRREDGTEATLNIGRIEGGKATNIVPDLCTCAGEIRSYSHEMAMESASMVEQAFAQAAQESGAKAQTEVTVHLRAYETPKDAPAVRRFQKVCRELSLPGTLTETFGGSDNNHFALHGITGIVLSCGMCEAHSVREYTTAGDLRAGALLVAGLVTDRENF